MEKVANFWGALFALFFAFGINAQTTLPPLERVVSIELKGASSQDALKLIESTADLVFGYRSDLVNDKDYLNRAYSENTVREILDDLFQGSLTYREKGNYIILKMAPEIKSSEITIEGYVFNAETGWKIPYVSVYDSLTLKAALSDEYGHYSIVLNNRNDLALMTSKYGFADTVITINASGNIYQNIYLTPVVDSNEFASDSLSFRKKIENWKIPKLSEEQKATIENFKENFKRKAQVSLLPMIGTNGVMAPSMTVDYSFNVIGGLNGGVNVLEVGGFFNAVWDTVRYAQVAGGLNIVGGPQYGAQVAGLANINGDSFEGAQVSGLLNITDGPFYGFQGAGVGNAVLGSIDGVQVSGVANYAGASSEVLQISPVANYAFKDSRGAQVSAVINVADEHFIGSQVSVVSNYSRDGFIGSQVTGLVNVAGSMTGSQIGLFNFSDSIAGVPFGLFSYSRKGLHQLEVSTNELTHLNLAFKTGTNQFYNSFLGGIRFNQSDSPIVALGYGIGTSVPGGGKNRIFFDFQGVNHFKDGKAGLALNNKFTLSYQFHLANKVALAIGPSANFYVVNLGGTHDVNTLLGVVPYNFYENVTSGGYSTQGWVGGHLSLRLF